MRKRFLFFVLASVLTISLVSAGWFSFTGDAVWASNWCSSTHKCPAGEGDCDGNSQCLTNYCAFNVGTKYNQYSGMDVCECPAGTQWSSSSQTCVSTPLSGSSSSGGGGGSGSFLGNYSLSIGGDYPSLVNFSTGDGTGYLIELLTASDTQVYLRVNSLKGSLNTVDTAYIDEGTSQFVLGLYIYLVSAESTANNGLIANLYISTSPLPNPANCTDSDGGLNYYVKGYTSGSSVKNYDSCYQDGIGLQEQYCLNGNQVAGYFNCPYGCSDGACLKSKETTTQATTINLYSPNGYAWACGPTNTGSWSCNRA